MRIFANHAHVFPRAVREDGTVDALLRVMDDCGIEKRSPSPPSRAFSARGRGAEPRAGCAHCVGGPSDRLRRDRFYAFRLGGAGGGDRRAPGFPGIKLHPAFQRFRVDGDPACRVDAAAERLGLFLSFHTGIHWHRIADYNLLLFDEVAYRFPVALRFSLEKACRRRPLLSRGRRGDAEQPQKPAAHLRGADERI